jgi:SAM-dependent methyltransferase
MEARKWEKGDLLGLSGIYWQTCTLHAGVRLGIFTVIGEKSSSAEEVASALKTDKRATETLCNALTAMGLIEKVGGLYRNTESALRFLVKSSPQYIGHMIMHHHHLMGAWQRLHEAVQRGAPVRRASWSDEERESFLMGMFTLAMGIAPALSDRLDLSRRRRLLDLGGGPGTYAIHFCLRNRDLKADVLDLPGTRPFAERTIRRFGVEDRVFFRECDYLKDTIDGKYDAAWLSHILHGEGPETCIMILRKAANALEPGGVLFIHEFILDDSMTSPLFPALFSLNMLAVTEKGRAYSEGSLRSMLKEAGAKAIKRLDFRGPTDSGIIAADF